MPLRKVQLKYIWIAYNINNYHITLFDYGTNFDSLDHAQKYPVALGALKILKHGMDLKVLNNSDVKNA